MIFDSYWPGGTRNTAWWKNVAGLLTEVASVRIATPVYIDEGELSGGRKGLPEYTRRSNFPTPWKGGWWRLRDIVEYELIATWALAETSSQYRQEFLTNFYRMGQEAVDAGNEEPPYGWIVSPDQHDPVAAGHLVDLLIEHGIRVFSAAAPVKVDYATYPAGTHFIPAAQPYRAFLLTMLRPQRYPEVVPYPGGPIFPPYDVTSWSLPISMGVEVVEIDHPLEGGLLRISGHESTAELPGQAAGGYLIPHSADSTFTAINRLLEKGRRVYWLDSNLPDGAVLGDIYLPPGSIDAAFHGDLQRDTVMRCIAVHKEQLLALGDFLHQPCHVSRMPGQ